MKLAFLSLFCAALAGCVAPGAAAAEQFVPLLSFRVGPYAATGSAIFGAYIDYLQYINEKEGGVNGVRLVWEECETEYNNARGVECYERLKHKGGGASVVMPLSTGITYSLIDRVAADKVPLVTIGYGRTDAADGRYFPWVFPMITTYWSQNTAMIKFIGQKEGGMDKLQGRKIVYLYHDSAYGKEVIAIMDEQAKRYGFVPSYIPVAHPGNEQQSQWLQIRQVRPDWVILSGFGVMNPTALKAAAKIGFPRERVLGVWWSGAEEDTQPAGDAAKGFIAAGFNVAGQNYPVVGEVLKYVYDRNKGNMPDRSRIGTVYYNRGLVYGIITVEAMRVAQARYGKGKALSSEQMRWGFEHIVIDDKRLAELGATGFMPAVKMSCTDHEGSGKVRFQQWDGKAWRVIGDWIDADRELVRARVETSATAYGREKGLNPRDCAKEQ